MIENPELSIVILCYKAEERILPFAQKVKELASTLTDRFEIVLVANYWEGSADRTKEVAERLAEQDPAFKPIGRPKEGMMGWDVKQGLSQAKGRYLCFIDGDGQYPVDSIAQCYQKIKTGEVGLVKSYRYKRSDGFKRKLISTVYNLVFSLLFPEVNATDINSKPKMFTREVYEKLDLSYDDWFIDAEIMIKASRLGVECHEFPVEFLELEGRASFVNFAAIFEFIRNLLAYRLRGR